MTRSFRVYIKTAHYKYYRDYTWEKQNSGWVLTDVSKEMYD